MTATDPRRGLKIGLYLLLSIVIAMFVSVAMLSPAHAGDTKTKIERVEIKDADGLIYVITSKPLLNAPSCHTRRKRMVFSTTRASAKMYLATLLTAISADKFVRLVGTNECTDRFNVETLDWVSIFR